MFMLLSYGPKDLVLEARTMEHDGPPTPNKRKAKTSIYQRASMFRLCCSTVSVYVHTHIYISI